MTYKPTIPILVFTIAALIVPSAPVHAKPPVKIILDTDFGDDGDDLAALALLHHFADLGEVEILAVGQSNSRWDAPGAIDVINTYYGRPDIPIGKVPYKTHEGDQYSSFLVKNYEFDLDLKNVPSAVQVYRRALAAAPDKSVTFVVVGFKSNMRDLLQSKPDDISPLSGVDLVKKKVILVSDMGGRYPSQDAKSSFNFKMVEGAAKYYVENWPTPMIFAGVGTGSIKVGHRIRKLDTPVGRAMDLKLAKGWKPNEKYQAGFDLASLLVAIRGVDRYFNTKSGCNRVEGNGANTFDYTRDCGHRHIDSKNQKIPFVEIGEILEKMMLAGPKTPKMTRKSARPREDDNQLSDAKVSGNLSLFPKTLSHVALHSVKDFGAKGDGVTDDFNAIQRCIRTVESKHKINYNGFVGESSYPEVVFPEGKYLISRPIVIAADSPSRGLLLRGLGDVTIKQTDPKADVFYFHWAYRHTVENLTFEGGRHQLKFFTRNLDCAHLTVRKCRFVDSASYAIDDMMVGESHLSIVPPYEVKIVDGLPHPKPNDVQGLPDVSYGSTMMRITGCSFENCMNVLRGFADWICMDHCRIETHPDMTGAAIYARGAIKLDHVKGMAHPIKGRAQRWIDNNGASLILQNVTLDAEGPVGMCPVYNRRIYDNGGLAQGRVIVDGCTFKTGEWPEPCVVYCEEIPNLISIRGSTVSSGRTVPALGFRKRPKDSYFTRVSYPELVARDPELARIYAREVNIPRVYSIGKERRKHNFAFVLDADNSNIAPNTPASMLPNVEAPLPPEINQIFARHRGKAVPRLIVTQRIDARDFGVKGDGVADDTAALQAACDAVSGPGCELVLPNGMYVISKPITLPKSVALRGMGSAVFKAASPLKSVFICDDAHELSFRNLAFLSVRTAANLHTLPQVDARIRFENCNFNLLTGPCIVCESGDGSAGLANATRLQITDSTFVRNRQVLLSNASSALFDYNWVTGSPEMRDAAVFVNKGRLVLADSLGVPGRAPNARQRWVDNYGDFTASNFRFGGEGNGFCNVMHRAPGGNVLIENCWVYCKGSADLKAVVYCEAIPETIALRDNTGEPVHQQKMVIVESQTGSDLSGRFFESGNTLPPTVIFK